MVANTDITLTNIPSSAQNYFVPPSTMNLAPHLLQSIDSWTKDDVQKWIEYCIDEYALGDINLNDFEMNGKALLLLSEDGFKQRSLRSGDILHKALQQHNAIIKSLNCQIFPYQLWNSFGLLPPSSMRHFNIPFPPMPPPSIPYMQSAFSYLYNRPETKYQTDFLDSEQSVRIRQASNSSSSSVVKPLGKKDIHLPFASATHKYMNDEDIDIEHHDAVPTPPITSSSPSISPQFNESIPLKPPSGLYSRIKQQKNDPGNDPSRQIRYYQDRIDFHGDILMKPKAAKNCRILWEFLYILLEDPLYESIIHWENREKMIFRINQADKLAALWGLQKNRLSMTYEKLSRGMRYYYSNNIISKEQSKRLLYRFMRSPDEIRKNMKRHGATTNMIYSTINKKSPYSLPTNTNNHEKELSSSSSSQIHNQFLHLLPTYSSMITNLNPTANFLYPTRDSSIPKSDRASSSSPESLDSSHDSEKRYNDSPHSFSSTTKRKQTLPKSLTTRLSHSYPFDQPLNLAVCKQE